VLAVRKRRRKRALIVIAVAALVLVLPVAAYAFVVRPLAAPDITVPPTATVSPNASASPEASATPTPSPVGDGSPHPGGFTIDELKNATLTVPPWEDTAFKSQDCLSGKLKFTNGVAQDRVDLLPKLSYVDVDQDGGYETVVLFFCRGGQVGPMQVAVLGREGSGIKTFGQVISTRDGISQIASDGITGNYDNTIAVTTRNRALCCDAPQASAQEQVRYYKWTGTKFGQVFGTTSFYPSSTQTDISIAVPDVVFGKPVNGLRTATVKFTIKNNGPVDADLVLVRLTLAQANAANPGRVWTSSRVISSGTVPLFVVERYLPPLRVGGQHEFEASITATAATSAEIAIRPLARAAKNNGDLLADTAPENNECRDAKEVKVSFS
jgi:hypothetical protein